MPEILLSEGHALRRHRGRREGMRFRVQVAECALRETLLPAERGVSHCARRRFESDRLRPAVPAGASALWTVEVLPEELALRQPVDRPVQAVRGQPGGMRAQVLQQENDSVLRERGLLSEEPLLLRHGPRPTDVLPARPKVRHPNPSGQRWPRSACPIDLLSTRALRHEGEALLPRRPGGAAKRGTEGRPRAQSLLLSHQSHLRHGSGKDLLPDESDARNGDVLQRQVRRCAFQPAELRVLRECVRIGRVQRRRLRFSLTAIRLPSNRA